MAKFKEVLKNRNFFFLWLGQIISQFGDRLDQMALIALIYTRAPGSTLEMAKLFSFTIIPIFLVGPIAGVYVDRWDRRRTMYACDLLRGMLVLSIPLILLSLKPMFPIYLAVFLIFCIGRFFIPAKMSIIPSLVKSDQLLMANSLVTVTGMIAAILGFGLGGMLVANLGVKGGFYLDSLTFFISGLLIFFINVGIIKKRFYKSFSDLKIKEMIKKSIFFEIKEGLKYLFNNPKTRFIVWILFFLWAALGAVYVIGIVFIQETLGTATKDLGFLIFFLGGGLLLGTLIFGKFGDRFSYFRIIFTFLLLGGLFLMAFTFLLNLWPYFFLAAILSLGLGICISPIMVVCNTLTQKLSIDNMRGKIFSSLDVVMHIAFLIFMFLSSLLAEYIGKAPVLTGVGALLILIAFFSLCKDFNEKSSRI